MNLGGGGGCGCGGGGNFDGGATAVVVVVVEAGNKRSKHQFVPDPLNPLISRARKLLWKGKRAKKKKKD